MACIAATGLIGCGKTDETSKKHEAITFMAPYLEVDSFIEEVHKPYPEIELEDKIQGNLLTITKYIEKSREIPIIAMTANAFAEDVQAALNAGMDDHVAKPVDMDILISAVEKCVKR